MPHLFADATDVLTRGTEFGFPGWVLSVLFVIIVGAAVAYFRYVFLPDRQQQREQDAKRFEADEGRRTRLVEATAVLSESMAANNRTTDATHAAVTQTHGVVETIHDKADKLVSLGRENVEALKLINEHLNSNEVGERIGAARAILNDIGDRTDEHPSLGSGELKAVDADKLRRK